MKLTPRFTLAFILYATALLVGVGLLAYNSGRASLRSATISELEATALRKESNLSRWIESKQSQLQALTTDPILLAEAETLTTSAPGSAEFEAARNMFAASVQPRLVADEFLEVSLIDPQTGQVLASTSRGQEGKLQVDQLYFINGKTGPFVENPAYSDQQQAMTMTASSPIFDEDGQLLAVLAARLDLEGLNTVISRRTDLHETDDAYLANAANLLVTTPRFIDDPDILQQAFHTPSLDRCLQQQASGVAEILDYRDVPSFVAYRWIPERQVCLIVKIDQAEAYAPILIFRGTIVAISLLALALAAALAIALARTMTRPILALQSGVARFANGELGLRLDETSQDELGELAVEFNKMAETLVEKESLVRRRAEQFFNLTLDLLCTVNPLGRLRDLNPAWEQTLGYKREELRGHLLTDLVHPDDLDSTTAALQQVMQETVGRFESRFRHRDGQYRWLSWVVVYSAHDQLLYAAARDITQRRLAEEQLRQKTDELERSNRELEQFVYVASHDLQEPLHLVSGYVQLLARRYKGALDEDADEFISFAVEGVNRMRSLIADLLAYSRIGSSRTEFVPVELEESLEHALENLQVVMQDTRTTVTHDPLPAVLGDDMQMVQLLQQLIDNAIKFHGNEPPRIHIGVKKLEEKWLFFVRDNGIGIDPQYTERVFVIFQRLHAADKYPGTGIGLAICRKIVERHGGRIWVDSEQGKGSTFYFTLQPAESWFPEQVPPEVVQPRAKDTVVDRASDLI